MTPAKFIEQWKASPVIQFGLSSPLSDGLSDHAAAVLRDFGLPQTAEPWLGFREFTQDDPAAAPVSGRSDLFPIGALANGSVICIEKSTDRIYISEADDPEDLWPLNSSLEALYESMIIFDAFISKVNRHNPDYAKNYRIPDGLLDELRKELTVCDPEAMNSHGYWHCELGVLDDGAF